MANVDKSSFTRAMNRLDQLTAQMPAQRREAHRRLARVAKDAADSGIQAALDDGRGKVRGWQRETVGSGGGYAAVRPAKQGGGPRYPSPGPNSPGAVTNYLEHGWLHRSGRRAASRGMYCRAKPLLRQRAETEARKLIRLLERGLRND